MSNPTTPPPLPPQVPTKGTELRQIYDLGAELGRIATYMRSQADIEAGNLPKSKLLQDTHDLLKAKNCEIPDTLATAVRFAK